MQPRTSRILVLLVSGVLALGLVKGLDYWRKHPLHASCEDGEDCRSGHCVGTSTRDGYIRVMVKGSGRCVSGCTHDSDCGSGESCTSVPGSFGPFVTDTPGGSLCLAH